MVTILLVSIYNKVIQLMAKSGKTIQNLNKILKTTKVIFLHTQRFIFD